MRTNSSRVPAAIFAAVVIAIASLAAPSASADTMSPGVRATASASAELYSDRDPSALTVFRAALSPHGAWVDDSTFGTVWVPSRVAVGAGFVPYQTRGYWTMTAGGDWLWKSSYPWGHIPFHYGRWVVSAAHGWVWIPGRTYAPAWVVWRVGAPGHVGWAPMAPTYCWVGGRALTLAAPPRAPYVFVPAVHVFREKLGMYVVRDAAAAARLTDRSHDHTPAKAVVRAGVRMPASPSLAVASVPGWAAPRSRQVDDPRAVVFSRPAVTAPVTASARPGAARPHGATKATTNVRPKAKASVASQTKVAVPSRAKAPVAGQAKAGAAADHKALPKARAKVRHDEAPARHHRK
jgi:hypothetical protein